MQLDAITHEDARQHPIGMHIHLSCHSEVCTFIDSVLLTLHACRRAIDGGFGGVSFRMADVVRLRALR
jgi:hypothetical protein